MLELTIGSSKIFNNSTNKIETLEGKKILLEHSLISISKWEFKYEKSFFTTNISENIEEFKDYIKFMSIGHPIDDDILSKFTDEDYKKIVEYMSKKGTATTIKDEIKPNSSTQFITSELVYSWMVGLNMPIDYEKWHINRLLTLITVCNDNNKPKKKYTPSELRQRNMAIKARRRHK